MVFTIFHSTGKEKKSRMEEREGIIAGVIFEVATEDGIQA